MANKWTDGSRALGKFDFPAQKGIYGELSLQGHDTELVLHDVDYELYPGEHELTIHGVVDHTIKVSLIDCIQMASSRKTDAEGNASKHRHTIFPHHIVFGDTHVTDDLMFTSIMLRLTDSWRIFYDFDAFGMILDPSVVKPVLAEKAKSLNRDIPVGVHPALAYFSGKHSIVSVPTEIGTISANNLPAMTWGGPTGSGFTNSIWVEIEFASVQSFNGAIEAAFLLEPFFSMVAGRPQQFEEIRLLSHPIIKSGSEVPAIFEVYSSMKQRLDFPASSRPQPPDLPTSAVRRPEEFAQVLKDWVKRGPDWRDARARYSGCLRKLDLFDIDRLVGSANMFDILPGTAVPADSKLSEEFKTARDQTRKLFLDLPDSPERASILVELKRAGKSSLKNKVRHRAAPIVAAVGDRFPELIWVLDQAVNCRNHYVHGPLGKNTVDYAANFQDLGGFFTRSLEFVFAASDLLEAGWDIKGWASRSSTLSHPFYSYKDSYWQHLAIAKALIEKPPA
ncbi:ApeA N-terminal domain 1-containing protein [Mesorhizobium sp. ORM8.1]